MFIDEFYSSASDTRRADEAHILVIEDDKSIQSLMCSILGLAGFRKITVSVGDCPMEGLVSMIPESERILAVIDFNLEQANGVHYANQLLRLRPDARIMIVSGIVEDVVLLVEVAANKEVEFLQKPFSAENFVARVQHMLNS